MNHACLEIHRRANKISIEGKLHVGPDLIPHYGHSSILSLTIPNSCAILAGILLTRPF